MNKLGIGVILLGFLICLISYVVWLNDNSNFSITGFIAIIGVIISWCGMMMFVIENPLKLKEE